jgi:hypothetical protein
VNDYFLINDLYYGADHARRQYYWEECFHDWINASFMRIKTSLRQKLVDLTDISWYYKRSEYNAFTILTAG